MNLIIYKSLPLLVLLYACSGNKNSGEEIPHKEEAMENIVSMDSLQIKNAGVKTGYASNIKMSKQVRLTGFVDAPPQSRVSISFPFGAYLKNTPLLPGFKVKKGLVIAVMECSDCVQLQQDYLVARYKMDYLSADMQRQRELLQADATSTKKYQMAESEYKAQETLLRALAEKLRMININPAKLTPGKISASVPVYSPIHGYTSIVDVNIGKYVNPSDIMFELVDPSDIHASMTVFEKDIYLFKKGQKGKVYLVDNPNKKYDVQVILVSKNLNAERTGTVHCHFLDTENNLLPGMFLNAVFETEEKFVNAVPNEAVVRYGGKEYVFMEKGNNNFAIEEVKIGINRNGMTEIFNNGSIDWKNNKIVLSGTYSLLSKIQLSGSDSGHSH